MILLEFLKKLNNILYMLLKKLLYYTNVCSWKINMLKLDLHLHSKYSDDAQGSIKELISIVQKKGLQGMAITDHNTVKGGLEGIKIASKDFVIIPGIEISSKDGHIIGLNIKEVIPRNLSTEETVERISEAGGIAIIPHLFRNMSGIKEENLKKVKNRISSIEVFNSCSLPKTNLKTAKIARKYDLGGTGGSDAHDLEFAGYGYTIIDNTDLNIDTILSEIQNKKTWGEGITMPLGYRRNRMLKSLKQFFNRGFKRI
jgi:predicted metal-dependent phosphoesterase TrpH